MLWLRSISCRWVTSRATTTTRRSFVVIDQWRHGQLGRKRRPVSSVDPGVSSSTTVLVVARCELTIGVREQLGQVAA